jgi:formate dehydrogenase subunit gamma
MVYVYSNFAYLIITLAVAVTIIITALHYIVIGASKVPLGANNQVIQRFSLTERVLHWIRMLSFIIVSFSGTYLIFREGSKNIGMLHSINGIIFLAMSIIMLILLYKQFTFIEYDRSWLRYAGGYLSKEHSARPAGKFNAGQKIFFWLIIVFTGILSATGSNLMKSKISQVSVNELVLAIHGISAIFVIVLVIGHIYLSLVANPGTWRVLISGKVTKEWVEHHHSRWNIDSKKVK